MITYVTKLKGLRRNRRCHCW